MEIEATVGAENEQSSEPMNEPAGGIESEEFVSLEGTVRTKGGEPVARTEQVSDEVDGATSAVNTDNTEQPAVVRSTEESEDTTESPIQQG